LSLNPKRHKEGSIDTVTSTFPLRSRELVSKKGALFPYVLKAPFLYTLNTQLRAILHEVGHRCLHWNFWTTLLRG